MWPAHQQINQSSADSLCYTPRSASSASAAHVAWLFLQRNKHDVTSNCCTEQASTTAVRQAWHDHLRSGTAEQVACPMHLPACVMSLPATTTRTTFWQNLGVPVPMPVLVAAVGRADGLRAAQRGRVARRARPFLAARPVDPRRATLAAKHPRTRPADLLPCRAYNRQCVVSRGTVVKRVDTRTRMSRTPSC